MPKLELASRATREKFPARSASSRQTGHADAAASAGGLEHQRVADRLGGCPCGLKVREQTGAGDHGHAGAPGGVPGGVLGAEDPQLVRGGADEDEAGGFNGLGEPGVLGEESVAGVDGAGPGGRRGREDRVHAEIGLLGRRGPEQHGFVGEPDVLGAAVGLGDTRPRSAGRPCGRIR